MCGEMGHTRCPRTPPRSDGWMSHMRPLLPPQDSLGWAHSSASASGASSAARQPVRCHEPRQYDGQFNSSTWPIQLKSRVARIRVESSRVESSRVESSRVPGNTEMPSRRGHLGAGQHRGQRAARAHCHRGAKLVNKSGACPLLSWDQARKKVADVLQEVDVPRVPSLGRPSRALAQRRVGRLSKRVSQ